MVKQILQFTDPILNKPSLRVKDFKSKELKQLITDLVDTADANRSITAGLAAPQIGVPMAVCVCRRVDLEKDKKDMLTKEKLWEVMINPEFIQEGHERSIFWEGCLSVGIGDDALFGPVDRPNKIKVKYQDILGNPKTLDARGFFAHEVQHEKDHLDGVVFLKYVTNPKNIWKRGLLDKYYDEFGDYPPVDPS